MTLKSCHLCGRKSLSMYGCPECGEGSQCRSCIKLHECAPGPKRERLTVVDDSGNDTGLVAFLPDGRELN